MVETVRERSPEGAFPRQGHRLEKAFGMGATVKELRVVRTPLRVELHVVLKHPQKRGLNRSLQRVGVRAMLDAIERSCQKNGKDSSSGSLPTTHHRPALYVER